MDELVKVNGTELQVQTEFLQAYHDYLEKKKELADKEKEFKKELIKAMEETGIKSFENEFFKFTYIAPIKRQKTYVDEYQLKLDGLYDRYVKEDFVDVKSSVRIYTK